MKNKDEYTEWIDDYLEASLKGEELERFERLMAEDPSFRTEVEAQKGVRKAIENLGDIELKAKFKKFHSDMGTNESLNNPKESPDSIEKVTGRGTRWNKAILGIAASITIMLIAGIWLMVQNRNMEGPSGEYTVYKSVNLNVVSDTSGMMGYAGENIPAESVAVELIADDRHHFHYRFSDTLQIFTAMPIENLEIRLQFDSKNAVYSLSLADKQYQLIRGLNRIVPLEETEPENLDPLYRGQD